jgi:hypothetical protein
MLSNPQSSVRASQKQPHNSDPMIPHLCPSPFTQLLPDLRHCAACFLRYTASRGTIGVSLFRTPSVSKLANPNHFRYFELRINQPNRSPNDQIAPLILPITIQITYPTSPLDPRLLRPHHAASPRDFRGQSRLSHSVAPLRAGSLNI